MGKKRTVMNREKEFIACVILWYEIGFKCGGCSCMRCIVVFQCSPLWRGWPWTLWTPSQRRSCSPASCAARCYAAKHPWNATLPTSTPSDRRSTDASSASGYTARVTPWWPTYIPIIRADPATLTLSSFEGLDKVGTRTSLIHHIDLSRKFSRVSYQSITSPVSPISLITSTESINQPLDSTAV